MSTLTFLGVQQANVMCSEMNSWLSCRFAGPFLGSYVASKHGLEGMAASLRRELMLFSIDVIIIGMSYSQN